MYLTPKDLKSGIREDIREMISGEDKQPLEIAESSAVRFMIHCWNRRYEISKIFIPCKEYLESQSYQPGQLMFWRDSSQVYDIYEAVQETQGEQPKEEGEDVFWRKSDPRDQYVIELIVSLMVYNFFKSEASHMMPETVEKSRNESRKEIQKIGSGDMLADLPKKEVAEGVNTGDFRWNSHIKEDNKW